MESLADNGIKVGASGIPLTTNAERVHMGSITVTRGEREVVLPVRYVLLPYVRLREMVFDAQRASQADRGPDRKDPLARFQDAHLLAAIREVDGVPFDTSMLLGLVPDIARGLVNLLDSAGVVDEGKSDPSSATGPGPLPTPPTPPSP